MKNGAPIKAVTTPIGKVESVCRFLEIKSENTKNIPPKKNTGKNNLSALCL